MIDTTAPTASIITCSVTIPYCAEIPPTSSGYATVRSTETGIAYLVKTDVTVSNVLTNITDADDNMWNSVDISADNDTNLFATGLLTGTYKVYAVDAAGNVSDASVGPGGWSALRGSMKVKP